MSLLKTSNSSKPASQNGQAIVEMCICLVGIMAVFLGLIFVSGLSISNVQTLFSAKINAETSSRNTQSGGAGQNINYWDYGSDAMPFTADDASVALDTSADKGYYSNLLTDPSLSESNDPNRAKYQQYIFTQDNYSRIPQVASSNFTVNFPDLYVSAADLVVAEGDQNTKVYTLKTNQYNTAAQIENISTAFYRLFGIRTQDIDLNKLNRVYMPVINSGAQNAIP
ncbi:MAG: hypothetical protein ACYC4Q_02265 [Victivallaceae bacterium]